MPPRKSTRAKGKGRGKAEDAPPPLPEAEEQPPLPEEDAQPPLPEEQPPVPDEEEAQPRVPDEQPPIPDEAPPLSDEAPPLPDEAPPLPDEAPPLPDEAPPLPDEAPPLPDEAPPLPTDAPPLPDEPVTELGEGAEGSEKKADAASPAHAWQAVWAPEKNAYYFWNTVSGAVTWDNPLAPASSTSTPAASASATPGPSAPRPAGGIPDIDPDLAYLLPAEARDAAGNALLAVTGKYQQRNDGAFAALDEYARQKRFGEAYFDVEAFERERGAKRRQAEEEGPRKVTKKDMERFKQKKAEKTRRARAWLYD